ncbi:TPA: acylneuraminate cytidylyltransferase family protein [Streptococcus suis]
MKIIAIIPARSGSKGLPDKNIKSVCGRPLMDYTIKAAIDSECFETVMVSTDSEKYAEIAKKCGADVPFMRSATTAGDKAGSWDVVREILNNYKKKGIIYDYVALLQPTSPLRSAVDIRMAVKMLDADSVNNVVSVTETEHPVQWCFTLPADLEMLEYAKSPYNNMRRQDLIKHYQENGAIYLVNANKIINDDYNLYEDKCFAYIMPRERSIDIDTKLDLIVLKAIIEENT